MCAWAGITVQFLSWYYIIGRWHWLTQKSWERVLQFLQATSTAFSSSSSFSAWQQWSISWPRLKTCCMQHWQATPDYLPCLAAFAVTSTGSSEAYSLRHSLRIAFILFITRLIQNSNIFCPQSLNLPLLVSSTLFVSTTWQTYIFKDWMNSNRNGQKSHMYTSANWAP